MQGMVLPMTKSKRKLAIETVTPKKAMELLEMNKNNRPITQNHIKVLAQEILNDRWKFNGDTIKIGSDDEVLDGQHRLWACVEANKPIETVIVYGVERDAFATIDTIRKTRTGSDILALNGATRYRQSMSQAIIWLLRWQRGTLMDYRAPLNKIQNSDIEQAYKDHPSLIHAMERAHQLRQLANPAILGFLYYVFSNRNQSIADRFMDTLEDPSGVSINDPVFKFRAYLTTRKYNGKQQDSLMTIALAIKAVNAVSKGLRPGNLLWRIQGKNPETFPKLEVKKAA